MEIAELAARGRETQLIDFRLVRLGVGERAALNDGGEQCAVVLGGVVESSADRVALGPVGGRNDVFDGPGEAVYVPPGVELVLAAHVPAIVAVASAPSMDAIRGSLVSSALATSAQHAWVQATRPSSENRSLIETL